MSADFVSIKSIFGEGVEGREVRVRGWVYRKRVVGKKAFVVLRDASGVVQCVVEKEGVDERTWSQVEEAGIESAVKVAGVVRRDARAPGGYEIRVRRFELVSKAEDFPIKGGEGVDYLLDLRHLWLRSRKLTAVMKIKHTVLKALREYYLERGWWEVTPPILTTSAVEGGATLFPVDFFGEKAYLSQSAQLYLEVLVFSLEKVWALTPSFRAERSRTRRHLYEYWHFEAEAAWMGFEDMMKVVEDTVAHVVRRVLEENGEELSILGRDVGALEKALATPYPRITYDEALEILKRKGMSVRWGDDLGADEERVLTECFETPFFITHFPKQVKSFYMKVDRSRPDVVLGFDLLAPEGYGEVVGGSEREDDYERLLGRILEEGLNPREYSWYLDLRRYGSVPHSGYGLGVERLVMWIAGLEHIRDATPFPRFRDRLYP